MEALVVRPILEGDEVSQYSYRWAEDVISHLKSANFNVNDLGGREVSKTELFEALDSKDPYVVVHYDHGQEDAWIGNRQEPIFSMSDAHMLSGRIAYSMNCLSAKKLGVAAWREGARAYVGYVEEFAFTQDGEALFREAVGHGLYLYLTGLTDWGEIKRRMVDKFNEMIAAARDPWTAMWLRSDRDALRVYNGEVPESGCAFRRAALKLLGPRVGWRVGRGHIAGFALFFFSFGIALWEVGGIRGLPGGYVGLAGMLLAFLLMYSDYVKRIRRR